MVAAWSRRLRWRRAGAWLWPVFIAATAADAVIGALLPPSGESQALVAAGVLALLANLIGVAVLSWPAALLLRRVRPDLPRIVARDHAGTAVVGAISAVFLAVGLHHHHTIVADRRAMQDAIVRAQAFIGDRAPAEFRRNLQWVSTFVIQPGRIYRACVPSLDGRRTYCVVVDTTKPLASSVRFGGYESNQSMSAGVN